MNKKQLSKAIEEAKFWQILCMFLIIVILVMVVLYASLIIFKLKQKESSVCYNMALFNETLEKINKNCGGTFITKQYGSNDWSVFQTNVCDGKKCEPFKYIPIGECLK